MKNKHHENGHRRMSLVATPEAVGVWIQKNNNNSDNNRIIIYTVHTQTVEDENYVKKLRNKKKKQQIYTIFKHIII